MRPMRRDVISSALQIPTRRPQRAPAPTQRSCLDYLRTRFLARKLDASPGSGLTFVLLLVQNHPFRDREVRDTRLVGGVASGRVVSIWSFPLT